MMSSALLPKGCRHLFPSRCLVTQGLGFSTKTKLSVDNNRLPQPTENSNNKKLVSRTLKNWFNLESQQISHIFKEFPSINSIDVKELQNKISLLNLKDLCLPEVALKRTWVLTVDKKSLTSGLKLLENKFLLKEIEEGKTHLFVMFIFDKRNYNSICKRIQKLEPDLFSSFDERLDFFRTNLDINSELFCAIVRDNIQILTKDMNHIKSVMQLLNDCVTKEDLINDHWIFNHNIDRMKRRIEESEGLLRPLKPWSLRCAEHIWQPMIENLKKDAEVLGDHDIVSYLTNKLECSRVLIEDLMARSPRTFSIRPAKLDQVITLLLQNGYTSSDILRCPRVLSHSPKRIEQRMNYNYVEKPKLSVFFND